MQRASPLPRARRPPSRVLGLVTQEWIINFTGYGYINYHLSKVSFLHLYNRDILNPNRIPRTPAEENKTKLPERLSVTWLMFSSKYFPKAFSLGCWKKAQMNFKTEKQNPLGWWESVGSDLNIVCSKMQGCAPFFSRRGKGKTPGHQLPRAKPGLSTCRYTSSFNSYQHLKK